MYIELLGLSGARIQTNDAVILLAPPTADSGLRNSRFKADIVVSASPSDQMNVAPNREKLFIIAGPGEYESLGVFFYCLPAALAGPSANAEPTQSLLSSITMEGMTVAHLAGLKRQLEASEMELFEGADILILPVGGQDVLTAKAAGELVAAIEPRVVIPMHFAKQGLKIRYDDITVFLKEMGVKAEPQERLRIVKKDLPQETTEIIHLL